MSSWHTSYDDACFQGWQRASAEFRTEARSPAGELSCGNPTRQRPVLVRLGRLTRERWVEWRQSARETFCGGRCLGLRTSRFDCTCSRRRSGSQEATACRITASSRVLSVPHPRSLPNHQSSRPRAARTAAFMFSPNFGEALRFRSPEEALAIIEAEPLDHLAEHVRLTARLAGGAPLYTVGELADTLDGFTDGQERDAGHLVGDGVPRSRRGRRTLASEPLAPQLTPSRLLAEVRAVERFGEFLLSFYSWVHDASPRLREPRANPLIYHATVGQPFARGADGRLYGQDGAAATECGYWQAGIIADLNTSQADGSSRRARTCSRRVWRCCVIWRGRREAATPQAFGRDPRDPHSPPDARGGRVLLLDRLRIHRAVDFLGGRLVDSYGGVAGGGLSRYWAWWRTSNKNCPSACWTC